MNCPWKHWSVVILSLSLIACGGGGDDQPESASPSSPQEIQRKERTPISSLQSLDPDDPRYVSLPESRVRVIRPDGFEDAAGFYGFQQASTGSSVMIATLPAPFAETSRGFTPAGLATQGIELQSRKEIDVVGANGVFLNVEQNAKGIDFEKWIVVFGDQDETTIVTGTFLAEKSSELSGPLRESVLSVRPELKPTKRTLGGLGFELSAADSLKPAKGIGKMLLYTKDGVVPMKSPGDPAFIAAPSITAVPIDDLESYAVDRLNQTAKTKIGEIQERGDVEVDGLEGYEIVATGEDDQGTPLVIYQMLLLNDGSYILMQGLVGDSLADRYLPDFKAMARSLRRTQK
ncbi:MAG: hypothetical protein RL885_07180 [Planctomycetota bacterium]